MTEHAPAPTTAAPAPAVEPCWAHFHHMADIGVRGVGASREIAFEQAALALYAVVTEPERIAPRTRIEIDCEAPNDGILLADWLNALIFETTVRRMLFSRFAVRIDGRRLHGEAWGEPIDIARHAPAVEPKGATLTELAVGRRADGAWVAQCVIDV